MRRNPGLRILAYHGICADEVAGEAWLPPHFVTASCFARQMRILSDLGRIVHLPDIVDDLASGRALEEPAFAITFDDGHACTLRHAVPAMDALNIRATFFAATGHIDDGTWFLSDRLRVLSSLPRRLTAELPAELRSYLESPTRFKSVACDEVRALVEECWPAATEHLGPRVDRTLHPMRWPDLVALQRAGHEIAAHTVSHVILARETRARRQAEIVDSIRRVREHVSQCVGFAYPNGVPGDFDGRDVGILRREGIHYAVTTTPGRCVPPQDVYRLPRTSIGLGHDEHTFTLEMSGRLDSRRRRQQVGAWAT